MVTGIRPFQTKKGDMMAWVTLEDMTGTIELVLFPRNWNKFQFALDIGGIIVAEGRADAKSNPPKVLVDNLRTQIKVTEPAQIPLQPAPGTRKTARPVSSPEVKPVPAASPVKKKPAAARHSPGNEPLPPEDPPEWATYTLSGGQTSTVTEPEPEQHEPEQREPDQEPEEVHPQLSKAPVVEPISPKVAPVASGQSLPEDHAPHLVTIILHPSDDPERDIRRISRLHGTFISYPGKDRFSFLVFEDGRGHLVEFPNDTTHICAELLDKITDAVGRENIRIELVTYQ
jgi:DNA polymerase-3 subunit alpha